MKEYETPLSEIVILDQKTTFMADAQGSLTGYPVDQVRPFSAKRYDWMEEDYE